MFITNTIIQFSTISDMKPVWKQRLTTVDNLSLSLMILRQRTINMRAFRAMTISHSVLIVLLYLGAAKKYFPAKQGTYNRRGDVHGAFPHSLLISSFVVISILVKNVKSIFLSVSASTKAMKFLCLLLLCFFSGGFSDPQKLVNIDFIGRGYDVFYGNPQSNQGPML